MDALKRAARKTKLGPAWTRVEAVHEGRVVSLKHFKAEVKSVRKGQECGLVLANWSGCEPGDVLTFYEIVARKPALYEGVQEQGGRAGGGRGSRAAPG